ncbi:zinc metalloprotease [Spirillospora sp. CA-294931]|uniref:zinc metalloprotease n=1 Tax=Spirillospora sp. CA-294931 TaxID=3240042 RepID=UPI003D8FA455
MKPLVAALLVALTAPAVPVALAGRDDGGREAVRAARDCGPSNARVRPGARDGRDRNELSATEALQVDRVLERLLRRDPETGRPAARAAAAVKIPVYFHVLHDGARGNVPDATVRRQIAVMNASYGGRNGGSNTGVSFVLRQVTRTSNASWYRSPEQYEETFKRKLHRGDRKTLNLYSADLGEELLGWSTFPWNYRNDPKMDGTVIHLGTMPGGSIKNFNRGYSATHEVGHWLGLFHTFQDGCQGNGDRVADTPAERDPSHGCPANRDTCATEGRDPVQNYMNYSWDSCMNQFTKGQGARMRTIWSAYRG